MATKSKEYLYCSTKAKVKIQELSDKLQITSITLFDIIMKKVRYEDCRQWHDEELNKERDGIK